MFNADSVSASLFASNDCTGGPYGIAPNSGTPNLTFDTGSVWVS